MLEYKNIYTVNKAQGRLKQGYRWSNKDDTADSDRLLLFTLGDQARRDSQANLDAAMDVARKTDMKLVIMSNRKVQLAGDTSGGAQSAANLLFSPTWLREFNDWIDSRQFPAAPTVEDSGQGEYASFHHYRNSFFMPEHAGVYDVATGQKLTNRREIIQRYWDLGFAAWRGRPVSIAQLKWSGTRTELEELTELADRYWHRGVRSESDVAKKIVAAYRSINRYAAWPGAW